MNEYEPTASDLDDLEMEELDSMDSDAWIDSMCSGFADQY